MIAVAEALEIVRNNCTPLSSERIPLVDSLHRVLAENVIADSDLPPFDRSQMDGFAVRAIDTAQESPILKIVGESAAGRGWHQQLGPGQAVRIMTGAPVPAGADAVQQVEKTREENGIVHILEPVSDGRSIVKRGSETQLGNVVLRRGDVITAAAEAVLASFGYAEVLTSKQPRVAVLATGSELVSTHEKPGTDQIRDSNNYSISAYSKLAGAVVCGLSLISDNPDLLRSAISAASEDADMIITSGGVSVGVYDFTKTVLRDLGAEILFERVALRPGKPTVFAKLPNGTIVFALPGNPVSVSVTFNLFARTALLEMQGAQQTFLEAATARLVHDVKGSSDRASYLPASLETDESGILVAKPLKWGGSSDFVAFANATALVVVPSRTTVIKAGEPIEVLRLPI